MQDLEGGGALVGAPTSVSPVPPTPLPIPWEGRNLPAAGMRAHGTPVPGHRHGDEQTVRARVRVGR